MQEKSRGIILRKCREGGSTLASSLEIIYVLFKFSSYKMGVSMNSWFLVTGRIYFKKKVFKYI